MAIPKWKKDYRDKAGNTLFKRIIRSTDTTQFMVKNREGKIVTHTGALSLIKKAGYKNINWKKIGKARKL